MDDIGHHFNSASHHDIEDLTIHVLDFIYAPGKTGFGLDLRLHIEHMWILTLRSMAPWGLYTMDKMPVPLYCRDTGHCTTGNKIMEARNSKKFRQ